MAAPHADRDDLEAYLSADDWAVVNGWDLAEVTRRLERASDLVDDLTGRANYDVDEDGLAVDADLAEALRKATCAVVEFWLEVGEENDLDGRAGQQVSTSGYSGARAPHASDRVLRPLKKVGLLAQPSLWPARVGL